jgi:hypothetical protein
LPQLHTDPSFQPDPLHFVHVAGPRPKGQPVPRMENALICS